MSDDALPSDGRVPGRLAWPSLHPVYAQPIYSNQFGIQRSSGPEGEGVDGFYLTFGIGVPPMLTGTPEEQFALIKELTGDTGVLNIEVTPQVRIFMTTAQLRRVLRVLDVTFEELDDESDDEGDN